MRWVSGKCSWDISRCVLSVCCSCFLASEVLDWRRRENLCRSVVRRSNRFYGYSWNPGRMFLSSSFYYVSRVSEQGNFQVGKMHSLDPYQACNYLDGHFSEKCLLQDDIELIASHTSFSSKQYTPSLPRRFFVDFMGQSLWDVSSC